jgi:hypothetical protein
VLGLGARQLLDGTAFDPSGTATATKWRQRLEAALAAAEKDEHATLIQRHYRGHAARGAAARAAELAAIEKDDLKKDEHRKKTMQRQLELLSLAELRRQAGALVGMQPQWLADAIGSAEPKAALARLLVAAEPPAGANISKWPHARRERAAVGVAIDRERYVLRLVAELNPFDDGVPTRKELDRLNQFVAAWCALPAARQLGTARRARRHMRSTRWFVMLIHRAQGRTRACAARGAEAARRPRARRGRALGGGQGGGRGQAGGGATAHA